MIYWIQLRLFLGITFTKVITSLLGGLPTTIMTYCAYNFLIVTNFHGLVPAPFLGVYGIILIFDVVISWIKNIE